MSKIISHQIYWETKPNLYEGDISYHFIESDVGELFAAETSQGLCQLSFMVDGLRHEPLRELEKHWPRAFYHQRPLQLLPHNLCLSNLLQIPVSLHVCGTPFQQRVWSILLEIPSGETTTYGQIARQLTKPKASQAVGQAVGANPVGIIIPCHRVLGADGQVGHYHWGSAIKQRLLEAEKAVMPAQ